MKIGDKVKIFGEWDKSFPFNEGSIGTIFDIGKSGNETVYSIFFDTGETFMFFDGEFEKVKE